MTTAFTGEQVVTLVRWLTEERVMTRTEGPETVLAIVQLGLSPAEVDWDPSDRGASRAWQELAESGRTFEPGMLTADLPFVGAKVLLEDPDNVTEWAAVGRAMSTCLSTSENRQSFANASSSPADWVERFFEAGRGPFWAMQMVARAAEFNVRPDLLGLGKSATPATLSEAAKAGLTTPNQVRLLAEAGFNLQRMFLHLDEGRVTPGALLAAAATNLPERDWSTMLLGLPERWFPLPIYDTDRSDPVAGGLLGVGYSWAQLRMLTDNGWTDLTTYTAKDRFGSGRNTCKLAPEQVVELSSVVATPDRLNKWVDALLTGGGRASGAVPALADYKTDMVDTITRLVGLGVKPSHIGAYRRAGCRSAADVAKVMAAGISPDRATELVKRTTVKNSWDRQRISSVTALIAADLQRGA